jgi:hypothetical protein
VAVVWAAVVSGDYNGAHSLSDMDDNREKLVQPIRIFGVVTGVGETQLCREGDSIEQLGVPTKVFLVFEPFEMESKDVRQSFDFHYYIFAG